MENQIFELQYAIDTFYFLVSGALVMWMAAGFAMCISRFCAEPATCSGSGSTNAAPNTETTSSKPLDR